MVIVLAQFHTGWSQIDSCRQLAFWNVENFFDTWHDTLKEDMAFTPMGDNHWTTKRYEDKRNKIYKVLAAMQWPSVVGLAEVENDWVLRDLCLGTPMRKMKYGFVHYESPDRRGVDCALLYRKDHFRIINSQPICVSDSSADFLTRDILLVHGILQRSNVEDTCYIFVNHWPSKLGGSNSDYHRMRIAKKLLSLIDSILKNHPNSFVLAMGDFNSSPEEEAIRSGLGFHGKASNGTGLYNLMHTLSRDEGSYKYSGQWSYIDQMMANRELPMEVFRPEWLLIDDGKYLGQKPYRTYVQTQYIGGYSDHLPIIVTIP